MRGCCLALLVLFSGHVLAKAAEQVPSDLVATHGFVFADFPKSGALPLTVQQLPDGKSEVLDPLANAAYGAQAFGRWLQPGQYRIVKWGESGWANGPTFDIEAGRVTDLGGLVPINIGGYMTMLLPTHHPENADHLQRAIQGFASLLNSAGPITWAPTTPPPAIKIAQPSSGLGLIADLMLAHDRKINKPSTLEQLKAAPTIDALLRLVREITPPLSDEPARAPDSTLYFPADLGRIRIRHPDGQWSSVGMDTLRRINAAEYVDGRLFAGSDDGHIRISTDNGATWQELKTLGPEESVQDIDQAGGTWVVLTEHANTNEGAPSRWRFPVGSPVRTMVLRVYLAHKADLSDLALSKEFVIPPKDQIFSLGWHGQLVDGRYFLTVVPKLQRLDLASGQWTDISPPAKVSTHRVNPASGEVTALLSQGLFSKVFVSSDHGDHWTPIGRPPYIIMDVQMDDGMHGWAYRWNMNAFSGVWETYAFDPTTNDWKHSVDAPFNCKPMRVATDLPLLCVASDSSLFGYVDDKWEVEFSAH